MKTNTIIQGDFRNICKSFPEGSIDLIFTDPPYSKEFIFLYEEIARISSILLKRKGVCIVYASDYWFDKTFPKMLKFLDFFYLFHLELPGQNALIFPRNIISRYKTLMVFSKGQTKALKRVHNCVISPKRKTGELHKWQQSEWPAMYMIQAFSKPRDVVLDVCVGSGTTCMAAAKLNRRYIGIDISRESCITARERLVAR